MRAPFFHQRFRFALPSAALDLLRRSICRSILARTGLSHRRAKASGIQYCLVLLLVVVVVGMLDWSLLQWLLPTASILQSTIRQEVAALKRLPHTVAKALRQPSVQYQLALLLATLLVILMGWTIHLMAHPRLVPVAYTG